MPNKPKRSKLSSGDKILNGRYEILKVIHSSGMSNVYLVSDSNLNKQWCLKEIRKSEAGKDQVEYYSLLQEANIMKSLNHSSIPRITTIEEEGDSIFIVMDYVDGMSVKSWLVKKGKINPDIVVAWMKQVTQVVMYLHNRKRPIFYRDMKPDNLMIQNNGDIKLLDFGISVVIKEEGQKIDRALGTKGYAAPEQSKRGNVCDLRSDIYGLGKTMYFMLTGINPSQVEKSKLKGIREIDSSISVGLEKIVEKCTRENPDERYQSCEELLYALQSYKLEEKGYISKLKAKCYGVFSLLIVSILLLIGSLVPLNLNTNQEREKYENLLIAAQQSERESDYEAVLNVKVEDISILLGYINSVKVDGSFSKEEEEKLLGYVNPNLFVLKSDKLYGEFAFNMGKLYWFYYEGSSEDGVVTSVKWFEDAMNAGYEKDLASVYYQLGMFSRDITASITESSDGGMYKEYWGNLLKARDFDNGDIVTLQLNMALASCIQSYSYNLKQDGVKEGEVKKVISELESFIGSYSPNAEKTEELYEALKGIIPELGKKVELTYK